MIHANDTDFTAEVIAAQLILSGVSLDNVVLLAKGIQHRSKRKDVVAQVQETSEQDWEDDIQLIETSREGLYDILPQGLFHQPAPPARANEQEIKDYFVQHRKEEQYARKFFLPFETAINHVRIHNTYDALDTSSLKSSSHILRSLELYWPIMKLMNHQQKLCFIKFLPEWYQARGQLQPASVIIKTLMELPIDMVLQRSATASNISLPQTYNNFGTVLGVDFTLGDMPLQAADDVLIINISIRNEEISNFVRKTSTPAKLLSQLCDYLLPVHLDYKWNYLLEPEDSQMKVRDKDDTTELLLGVNTEL